MPPDVDPSDRPLHSIDFDASAEDHFQERLDDHSQMVSVQDEVSRNFVLKETMKYPCMPH